jgi:hypothetical protein
MADDAKKPTAEEQRRIDEKARADSLLKGGMPRQGNTGIAGPQGSQETFGDGSPAFAGYPVTKYHPVFGARTVNDPNEAHQTFNPPHNWFSTAGQADAARTDREAQQVVFHNLQTKVDLKHAQLNEEEPPNKDRQTIVRNSVQAQESLDAGKAEPL